MRDFLLSRVGPGVCALAAVLGTVTSAAAQAAPATTVEPAAPAAVAPQPLAALPPPGYAYPPPPGYAYPPPPPGYGYPPPYAYARPIRPPESVPYRGGPVPAGYHLEERRSRALIISGGLVLGIPWVLGASVVWGTNFPNHSGWLLVPALGPWLTLATRHDSRDCNGGSTGDCFEEGLNAVTRTVLVLDGLMQTAGAVMLVVGLTTPHPVVARNFVGSLHITPMPLGRQGYGGFLTGQF